MSLSPYSARMASQVCLTMTEMVLCATLKPNISLLYFSPVAKKRSVIASLHPGLIDFLYICVIFLNSGPHPLQDLSEHGRVHPDKISERDHILSLQLPHQTIIVSIVQPHGEPGLHPIPPGPWSTPSLSVNQYLCNHNLIL